MNIGDVEEYYGENISIYFEFFHFYNRKLIFPAFFALIIVMNEHFKFFEENLHLNPIYGFFVVIWYQVFAISWLRKEKELSIKWGTHFHSLKI